MVKKEQPPDQIHSEWSREQEELLAEWSEKASCYARLHNRSEKKFRFKNYAFTIPVIIMSTLTGTANFGIDSMIPPEHKKLAQICIGGVNLFAGILSTLHNFLHYAENMEAHRLAYITWSKFQRNIAVELVLDPRRRKHAGDFLKVNRAEYDRLIEQSPSIPSETIKHFKKKYGDYEEKQIRVPEICNGLIPCKIFEPTKEEKATEILKNTTEQLRGICKHINSNHGPHSNTNHLNYGNNGNNGNNGNLNSNNSINNNMNNENNINHITHTEKKQLLHNELSELKNVQKVSSIKEMFLKNKQNNEGELNINNIVEDIKLINDKVGLNNIRDIENPPIDKSENNNFNNHINIEILDNDDEEVEESIVEDNDDDDGDGDVDDDDGDDDDDDDDAGDAGDAGDDDGDAGDAGDDVDGDDVDE